MIVLTKLYEAISSIPWMKLGLLHEVIIKKEEVLLSLSFEIVLDSYTFPLLSLLRSMTGHRGETDRNVKNDKDSKRTPSTNK